MNNLLKLAARKRQRHSELLGLTLDGGRLEGVVLRRTNGSLQVLHSFAVTLSLDPLTNDPALVGREIRNHLDAVGVRERHCVVGVPLKWALVTHVKLPDLPESDVANFLQIEAERGFPCDVATLLLVTSRYRSPAGEEHATLIGIPRNHVALLEQVLRAAQLKPVSFSLGITALQPPASEASNGVLALAIGESQVGLQISCGGGVVALRALEGVLENEGGRRQLNTALMAREVRITLGQLPPDLRQVARRVRIFGPRDLAQKLVDEFQLRLDSLDIGVEVVTAYAPDEFGVQLPPQAGLSAAFSLAAWPLAGLATLFEFLPPKVTAWQQLTARYSSGKLQRAAIAAAALFLVVGGLFGYQQWQLMSLRSKWVQIGPKVREIDGMQQQIRRFRPWFDESVRSLNIMQQLTEAFPEDGVVTAKTLEIRDQTAVVCSGTARDHQALLKTLERLRSMPRIAESVKLVSIRGKSPMQFSFGFVWSEGKKNEN